MDLINGLISSNEIKELVKKELLPVEFSELRRVGEFGFPSKLPFLEKGVSVPGQVSLVSILTAPLIYFIAGGDVGDCP